MSKNTFTVTVDLKAFFANHKSKVKLFINENIKKISDFEDKITEIFGIQKYHLVCNDSLLPSCEDIRVLQNGDTVCAIPNEDREEVFLLDKTYYKEKEARKLKKEKKRHIVEDECPIVEKKQKKKKREVSTPPQEIEKFETQLENQISTSMKKEKTKDKVTWCKTLPKTTNHVKIEKTPLKTTDLNTKYLFEPVSETPTPDLIETTKEHQTYSPEMETEEQPEPVEYPEPVKYPIMEPEAETFSTLASNNNESTPTSSYTKKETELKNWKHSILEKFTHQASEQNNVEKNEISSTNREKDEFQDESSSNSVITKINKINPNSFRIKRQNYTRQTSGVSYYLKLMDKIGWDSSKSISEVDTSECCSSGVKTTEEKVENSINGDSVSDYQNSDFVVKRKRKRKHKKRTRAATPIPRFLSPLPLKYFEEISSNGSNSTPKHHIRFGESVQELVPEQGTAISIDSSSAFEESKSDGNVKILQNFPLNSDIQQENFNIADSRTTSCFQESEQYPETLKSSAIKNICEACENGRPSFN